MRSTSIARMPQTTVPSRISITMPGLRLLRRVGSSAIVLWAVATLGFVTLQLAPGDIVDVLIGDQPRTPAIEHAIRAEWGLDRPLLIQYLSYLWRLLHGDFGRSYVLQTDVATLVFSQCIPTIKLTAAALFVALVFGVTSAVLSAGRVWSRKMADALDLLFISTPSFWLGTLLLFLLSFTFHLFPVAGDHGLASLVLPALSLGLSVGAMIGQVLRHGLERALEQPFALTVRSLGVNEWVLRLRNGLRHAALPATTLTGWIIGQLLSGAVVTERVFGRPGLGRVTVDAVLGKDRPVVLAVIILSALIYVGLSTAVEGLCLLLDPRLRTDQTGKPR